MRFCLALILLGSVQGAVVPTVLADAPDAKAAATGPSESQPRVSEKQARTRLAMSGVGIVLSVVGITMGAVLVRTPDVRQTGPDAFEDVKGAERKRTAGTVLLVVSPIALGASIFGVVRSKRNRLEARGEVKQPREPASWR